VFINDPDIDPAFAEAEPPTHDDWQSAMVADKNQRRLVNVALRNLEAELRSEFGGQPRVAAESVSEHSSVVVANALGVLLATSVGAGPWRQLQPAAQSPSSGSRRERHPTVTLQGSAPIVMDGRPATELRFSIAGAEGKGIAVTASAAVAIDGARPEREPPLGTAQPEVVGWRESTDHLISRTGLVLHLSPGEPRSWTIVVMNPDSLALAIDLEPRVEG